MTFIIMLVFKIYIEFHIQLYHIHILIYHRINRQQFFRVTGNFLQIILNLILFKQFHIVRKEGGQIILITISDYYHM